MPKCDFSEKLKDGIQYHGVIGNIMDGSENYIFYWDDISNTADDSRKLVQTNRYGKELKCGYLLLPALTWKDPSSWLGGPCQIGYYQLKNCAGFGGK